MISTNDRISTTDKVLRSISLCAILALASCGGGSSNSAQPATQAFTGTEKANTVVLMVLGNINQNEVLGSADAPFLNSLVSKGTLATNYYANVHPSMGDYFMMTSGNIVSTDDAFAGDGFAAGNCFRADRGREELEGVRGRNSQRGIYRAEYGGVSEAA